MDRNHEQRGRPDRGVADALILPSRREARDLCRAALDLAPGVVLLAGEAGVGKTWLWRGLAAEARDGLAWLGIDLTPATTARSLFRSILRALGDATPGASGGGHDRLGEVLAEESEAGRRYILVLDEAHNGTDALLEEVRVLANRLGRPDGFAALVLCGGPPLPRRLRSRALAALDSRVAARIHLGPLPLDEARAWLQAAHPEASWGGMTPEDLHRWGFGNPRRIATLAAGRHRLVPSEATARDAAPPVAAIEPPAPSRLPEPFRPPLSVGEGVVEVGWDADAEAATVPLPATPPEPPAGEETIDDPYAALQAWQEWSGGRDGTSTTPATGVGGGRAGGTVHVWSEGRQPFGPYGDHFGANPAADDAA